MKAIGYRLSAIGQKIPLAAVLMPTADSRQPTALLGIMIMVFLATAAGCNQVTSQALNSEGVRLFQNGNYPQAAEQFQRAIASEPNSATSYYNLASSLHKSGKLYNRQDDLDRKSVV